MTDRRSSKIDKIERPEESYARPADVVGDDELSLEEKKAALDTWEQDARQLVTASNEGMKSEGEGRGTDAHHQLDQVVNAKECLGAKPHHKPSQ
jgi:hypothetical protein